MNMDVKDPDVIGWQVINMMFPPDDQPNLAEKEEKKEEKKDWGGRLEVKDSRPTFWKLGFEFQPPHNIIN